MSYWQMDDAFLGHHKTVRALRMGAESLQMWIALRTYVAVNTTDGDVPDEDIDDLPHAPKNPRKWLAVLVECGQPLHGGGRGAGLVDKTENGWRLHNYERHGLSADEIEKRKEAARERKKRWRGNASGTRSETRDGRVPGASGGTGGERGTDAPPFPFPIPSPSPNPEEKKIPLPPSEPDPRPDPMLASLQGRRTQDAPDVVSVFDAWRLAHGFTGAKFRQPADVRADILHEAIATHGVAQCLRVIEASKADPMVTGKADERGLEHRSVEYIFKPTTFDRLLRAADEAERKKSKSVAELTRQARAL